MAECKFIVVLVAVGFAMLSVEATAQQVVCFEGSVSFTSDLEDPDTITLPQFDTLGGTLQLLDVEVEFLHEGSMEPAADNDDPFQSATVRARVIRQWTASGPDVFGNGSQQVNSPFVDLDPDDGDLANFDPNPPDGFDFGSLGYSLLSAGLYYPDDSLYEGVGSVVFTVTPLLMVNDLQFQDPPGTPDAWQLEVENPILTVTAKVCYTYIPEPASIALLALGGLLALRRRP